MSPAGPVTPPGGPGAGAMGQGQEADGFFLGIWLKWAVSSEGFPSQGNRPSWELCVSCCWSRQRAAEKARELAESQGPQGHPCPAARAFLGCCGAQGSGL